MRAKSRAHYSYPKAGCRCGRCGRIRHVENITASIALYEDRMAEFRREDRGDLIAVYQQRLAEFRRKLRRYWRAHLAETAQ